jgi:hypothetical protein
MSEGLAQPVVLDTTVISNFAASGSLDTLFQTLERPVVVSTVQNELSRGASYGHEFLEIRFLVLPGVDVGVHDDVEGEHDGDDARDEAGPHREQPAVGGRQPLRHEAEQRRGDHGAGGEPHSRTFQWSPTSSNRKKGTAPSPVASAVTRPATNTEAYAPGSAISVVEPLAAQELSGT